jgi:hypothetical protein
MTDQATGGAPDWRDSLRAAYPLGVVPLAEIAGPLFGMQLERAVRMAKLGTLPVPAYQVADSQKAPWLVRVDNLVALLESGHTAAVSGWLAARSGWEVAA